MKLRFVIQYLDLVCDNGLAHAHRLARAAGVVLRALSILVLPVLMSAASTGCNSIKNGWLDPTVLGSFEKTGTLEIRGSLTLEDSPIGIPGSTYPSQTDLQPRPRELPLSAGDELGIEIHELRQRQVPFQARVAISAMGDINLPVVGSVHAAGFTADEFQEEIKRVLMEKDILRDPDVTVTPLLIHKNTYSIFGIGVSASDSSPLRAGVFPISRPDLRVLEAINRVGGLNEFVTDIYLFRYEDLSPPPAHRHDESSRPASDVERGAEGEPDGLSDLTAYEPVPRRHHHDRADGARAVRASHPAFASPVTPEDVLLDMAEREHRREAPEREPIAEEDETLLTPEPTQPYLFVEGKWVPNPEFQQPPATIDQQMVQAGQEMITPAINWARIAGETTYRILRVPADPLRDGDPSVNVVIRPGDVIRIVSGEIGTYYVMGQVNRVGTFGFNAEKITLKSAIAAAGGLSGLAWPDRCTVYRRVGQREQMIQVNLDRIFAGLDEDFIIKRGDIINVGTHPFAPVLQQIRNFTIPNVVSNVGYSFTYARNFADIDSFSVRTNPRNEPDRFPNFFP